MASADSFLSILAISQLAFLGIYIFAFFRNHRVARIVLVFAVCLTSFLFGRLPFVEDGTILDSSLGILASQTPAALWIFAVSVFSDDAEIPRQGLGLIALYFTLQVIGATMEYFGYPLRQLNYAVFVLIPLVIMLGLSVHVIYMGVAGRMADLVEERRRIRMPFVIIMGVVIIFVLLFGTLVTFVNVFSENPGEPAYFDVVRLVIAGAIFCWAILLNVFIFRFRDESRLLFRNVPGVGEESDDRNNRTQADSKTDKLISKIRVAMEEQKRYRETGFTISGLAEELKVTEQRLRTAINKKLGYRNFNQFLNHYRVREAAEMLSSSDDSISGIAMEVGYNSLSSFNKAFRESYGMPPREWRISIGAGVSEQQEA